VCGPSKYYEPEIPGCNYCDPHYYPDPEDPWNCLECVGRVSEDYATCEPCGLHEVWNSVTKQCVPCYGIVENDGVTCSPCYEEGDEDLQYYDTEEEECNICIGELTEDPTECISCAANKYFYEPQLECINCIGTVSDDYLDCIPCNDADHEYFETGIDGSKYCTVCYGTKDSDTECTYCTEPVEYADDDFDCYDCDNLHSDCVECDLEDGDCNLCDTDFELDLSGDCVACDTPDEYYDTDDYVCRDCDYSVSYCDTCSNDDPPDC